MPGILCQMALFERKNILPCKYFRYLHQTNTTVFTITPAIQQVEFHLHSTIITKISYLVVLFILWQKNKLQSNRLILPLVVLEVGII